MTKLYVFEHIERYQEIFYFYSYILKIRGEVHSRNTTQKMERQQISS